MAMMPVDTSPRAAARAWAWPAAITALGLGLRIFGLDHHGLWYDEAAVLQIAGDAIHPSRTFDPDYTSDAPLFPLLVAGWYGLMRAIPGVEPGSVLCDFLLRLFPALVGTACIPLVFLLGRRVLGNERPALIAAFLFAISPFQVYYAQDLRNYSLMVAINLAAAWCLIEALEKDRPAAWAGLVASMALGIYNHFFMVWYIVAFNLYALSVSWVHRRRMPAWIAANLCIILLSVPSLYLMLFTSLLFDTAVSPWYPPPDLAAAAITFKSFFAGYSPNAPAYKALTLLALAFSGAGLLSLYKKPRAALFLLILAAAPIALSILYWRTKEFPYYTHRLMIFSAVPCYLLIGQGAGLLRNRFAAAAVAAFGVLTLPPLADMYAQRLHPLQKHTTGILYKNQTRDAAAFVAARFRQGDVVLHRLRYTFLPFRYYLDAPQHVVELDRRGIREATQDYTNISLYLNAKTMPLLFHDAAEGAQRIWFVNSWWDHFGSDTMTDAMPEWLDARYRRVAFREFDGLDVYCFEPARSTGEPSLRISDDGTHALATRISPGEAAGREFIEAAVAFPPSRGPALALDRVLIAHGAALYRGNEYPAVFAPDGHISIPALGLSILNKGGGAMDGVQWSAAAVDTASASAVLISAPLESTGPFSYGFTISNPSPGPATLVLDIAESVETMPGLGFTPLEPNSSAWRPARQETLDPYPLPFANAFALVAHVSSQVPDEKSVYRDIALPPGEYRVYLRRAVRGGAVNLDGAFARVAVGTKDSPGAPLGIVAPVDGLPESGWRWTEAGTFTARGEAQRMVITALNRDNLRHAYFRLDRVAIVSATSTANAVPGADRTEIQLAPGETRAIQRAADMNGQPRKRIDIETYDAAGRAFRSVHFTVRNGP